MRAAIWPDRGWCYVMLCYGIGIRSVIYALPSTYLIIVIYLYFTLPICIYLMV